MDKLAYSYDEAAAATGVSVKVLQRAVKDNKLVPAWPNARPIFDADELKRWIKSLPSERP